MTDIRWLPILLTLAVLAALVVTFDEGLVRMVTHGWQYPEYQHGFVIPLVSLYLVWARATDLQRTPFAPSWLGVAIVVGGLVVFLLGELSAIFVLVQYAFLITLVGLAVTVMGVRAASVIWAGLVYLVFMIPLPNFLLQNLSGVFQIWSSEIGTAFLRLVGVSVYLEGNVIDLGSYKLQVVDACSGLRYLFPLMSFAFFCAYIFRGPLWQKLVIFVSSVPITIFMNSFRIAVTGVLVNRFGTGQAEGFLHYFEGWVIFVACIALLFAEMAAFALLSKRKLADAFEVEIPELGDFRYLVPKGPMRAPVTTAVVLVLAGALVSLGMGAREELVPQRSVLATFPLVINQWRGRESRIADDVLAELKATDYLVVQYQGGSDPMPVELYVAYYESQRKEATVHSPRSCLPGGGWMIVDFSQRTLDGVLPDGGALPFNRAVIAQGGQKALVYYWFMQRGRYLTNEFAVKWYIFWDALTQNRTDGAMVRVMMPVPEGADVEEADRRLAQFIGDVHPKLYYYIPQEQVVPVGAAVGAAQPRPAIRG